MYVWYIEGMIWKRINKSMRVRHANRFKRKAGLPRVKFGDAYYTAMAGALKGNLDMAIWEEARPQRSKRIKTLR